MPQKGCGHAAEKRQPYLGVVEYHADPLRQRECVEVAAEELASEAEQGLPHLRAEVEAFCCVTPVLKDASDVSEQRQKGEPKKSDHGVHGTFGEGQNRAERRAAFDVVLPRGRARASGASNST